MPSRLWRLGDDVYHPTNGICAESHRDNAFVHLDAAREVDRYIIETECTTYSFLRNAVNKHLDVFSAEAVERDIHVRSHTTSLANLHTWCSCQRVTKRFSRVLQHMRVDGYGVKSRTPQPAEPTCGDFHFAKAVLERK